MVRLSESDSDNDIEFSCYRFSLLASCPPLPIWHTVSPSRVSRFIHLHTSPSVKAIRLIPTHPHIGWANTDCRPNRACKSAEQRRQIRTVYCFSAFTLHIRSPFLWHDEGPSLWMMYSMCVKGWGSDRRKDRINCLSWKTSETYSSSILHII